MAAPKLSKDLEGDTPEQVAWGLLEWIRLVEDLRDRQMILGVFHESLMKARSDDGLPASAVAQPTTGVQRRLAYRLMHLIAEMEGRDPGQRNQGDRKWILDTYSECLETVLGRNQAVTA